MPITALRASPYSHPWGASIYAKVIFINVVGESTESAEGNNAIILTVPDAPINLANNPVQTSATQISISWANGATNGGASVLDYRIYYDQGTNNYVPLSSGVTMTSYLVSGVIAGTTYKFKV